MSTQPNEPANLDSHYLPDDPKARYEAIIAAVRRKYGTTAREQQQEIRQRNRAAALAQHTTRGNRGEQ